MAAARRAGADAPVGRGRPGMARAARPESRVAVAVSFGAPLAPTKSAMLAPIPARVERRPRARPPAGLRLLYRRRQIRCRVRELAREIRRDYRGRDLVVVGVLKGAFVFTADLVRALGLPVTIDFVGLSSYRDGTESTGAVEVRRPLSVPIDGRDVLVVEDLIDTGSTLSALLADLRRRGARSVRVCALLDKPERRVVDVRADYVGFTGARGFVAGYGIDYAERYRALPDLFVIEGADNGRPT
jgi:hypoxanthine phosphoribosyltransferase